MAEGVERVLAVVVSDARSAGSSEWQASCSADRRSAMYTKVHVQIRGGVALLRGDERDLG